MKVSAGLPAPMRPPRLRSSIPVHRIWVLNPPALGSKTCTMPLTVWIPDTSPRSVNWMSRFSFTRGLPRTIMSMSTEDPAIRAAAPFAARSARAFVPANVSSDVTDPAFFEDLNFRLAVCRSPEPIESLPRAGSPLRRSHPGIATLLGMPTLMTLPRMDRKRRSPALNFVSLGTEPEAFFGGPKNNWVLPTVSCV